VGHHCNRLTTLIDPNSVLAKVCFVVQVRCSTQKMNGAGRVLDFEAYVGTIKFGESRVRYVDQLGANPEPGFEMLVCDWQLGRDTEPLAECPDVSAGPN
jgi:hypothetical protein